MPASKEDTMICEKCGKKMIKSGQVLLAYPAQYFWVWWCGCSNKQHGSIQKGQTMGEIYMEPWKWENDGG